LGTEKWFNKNKNISKKNRRIPIHLKEKYKIYCFEVDKYTNISIKIFNLKDNQLLHKNKSHAIDHKISKYWGFMNNIKPFIIGSIHNLEVLETKINSSKQEDNSIEYNYLEYLVENDRFYRILKEEYEKIENVLSYDLNEKHNTIIKETLKRYY